MSIFSRRFKIGLVVFLSAFLSQCNKGEGPSGQVTVASLKKTPLIRFGPKQLSNGVIDPLWFDFAIRIENNSALDVVIEEVLFYVTADGVEQAPRFFDLSYINVLDASVDPPVTVGFKNYCKYRPGYKGQLRACQFTGDYADVDDVGETATSKNFDFHIGGIPETANGVNAFRVRVEILGLFVDANGVDQNRLLKTLNFTTR